MYGWSFSARTVEEVGRLLRAMEKHRYLAERDLRVHWALDMALAGLDERFAEAAVRFQSTRSARPDIEMGSRDPSLWRPVDVEQVLAALAALWEPGSRGEAARAALSMALRAEGVLPTSHEPFAADADEPPHPELILLDWTLLPVDQLDVEHHAGALRAMQDSGDEVEPSAGCYVEGPTLSESELTRLTQGVLPVEPVFWADGPYSYCDYVFRGVARAAKLVDPPSGYRDFE
jgi:hypothetical protein